MKIILELSTGKRIELEQAEFEELKNYFNPICIWSQSIIEETTQPPQVWYTAKLGG